MKDCTFSRFQERRIKSRHAAPCLGVTLRPAGVLNIFRRSEEVKCLDINRYGMAIECGVRFREGEKVLIDFKGKYICQSNIKAVVSSATQEGRYFRYGLTFSYCLDSKLYSREEDNALSRIESLYNSQYQEKAQS
ncbi:MAG: PilZ domain-containing protein [Hahellaceae bacterium]|nr:PilZ domain-containing protein [Hahellaceae bacterium]MCP5211349.1 PilZ domain-containing protein [Hahellaceae bacterium]